MEPELVSVDGSKMPTHIVATLGTMEISVATYNICMAKIEQDKYSKFQNREKRILDLIEKELDADVLGLQEVRDLNGCTPVGELLGKLYKMGYDSFYQKKEPLKPDSMANVICWKRNKFAMTKSHFFWVGEGEVQQYAGKDSAQALVVGVTLAPLAEVGGNPLKLLTRSEFQVFSTHFPFSELNKKGCALALRALEWDKPTIICGDFNFFWDLEGKEHYGIMEGKYVDTTHKAVSQTGFIPRGTFVGFEHDLFKSGLPLLTKNKIFTDRNGDQDFVAVPSRIDYIWMARGDHELEHHSPSTCTKTMHPEEPEELSCYDLPSDHIPVMSKFVITLKDTVQCFV